MQILSVKQHFCLALNFHSRFIWAGQAALGGSLIGQKQKVSLHLLQLAGQCFRFWHIIVQLYRPRWQQALCLAGTHSATAPFSHFIPLCQAFVEDRGCYGMLILARDSFFLGRMLQQVNLMALVIPLDQTNDDSIKTEKPNQTPNSCAVRLIIKTTVRLHSKTTCIDGSISAVFWHENNWKANKSNFYCPRWVFLTSKVRRTENAMKSISSLIL